MLKKSFISFAIIVSGLFLADQAYGQKEIVIWGKNSVQPKTIKSPRDVASGQLIDTSTGEVVWAKASRKKTPNNITDAGLGVWARSPRPSSSLIDTSTGEIEWPYEVRGSANRVPRRSNGIFDVYTGEIL